MVWSTFDTRQQQNYKYKTSKMSFKPTSRIIAMIKTFKFVYLKKYVFSQFSIKRKGIESACEIQKAINHETIS